MYQTIFKLQENIYKALASEKRLEIIQLLRENELTVSQIQDMLGIPQANLSQHLQVLREHNLVTTQRKGKYIYYKLYHFNISQSTDLVREMLIDQNKGNTKVTEELRLKMKDLVPLQKDLVCGMRVSPKTAAAAHKHKHKTYYFCASGCKKEFKNNPKKYLKG